MFGAEEPSGLPGDVGGVCVRVPGSRGLATKPLLSLCPTFSGDPPKTPHQQGIPIV